MKKILYTLFSTLILFNISKAQNNNGTTQKCGELEYYNELKKIYPQLEEQEKEYRNQFNEAMKNVDFNALNKTDGLSYLDTTTQYKIALVFHILHSYNELGSDWVTDLQIQQTVAQINKDYNGSYEDTAYVVPYFKNKVGNCHVTFYLANKDPYGNCTNGIDRIHSYKTLNGGDGAKLNQWPNTTYVNVWSALIANGTDGQVAAYAIKPSTAAVAPYRDGVMSTAAYTTGSGTNKYTISHELGHIFNLDHLWGSTNTPGVACGDDDVEDTPPTKGHYSVCPLAERETACWSDTSAHPYYKIFLEDTNAVSNNQNIMEYAYCDRMFSKGQVRRMRATMQNLGDLSNNAGREKLKDSLQNALAGINTTPMVCAPKADFYASRLFVVGNTNTVLKNFSHNALLTSASYNWEIPNATPSTSTAAVNQLVSYNTTGWQNVKLTTTVGANSGVKEKQNFIFVQDPNVVNGVTQDFESDSKNAKWPLFNYYDNMFKWEIVNYGAHSGTKCVKYSGYDNRSYPSRIFGDANDDYDDFYTEVFNPSAYGAPRLNFWLASTTTTTDYYSIYKDGLYIQYSTDGGASWRNLDSLKGTALYNNSLSTSDYTPWYGSYQPISIPLTNALIKNATSAVFRFRMKPGNKANNTYIDDIALGEWITGVDNTNKNQSFTIAPNPLRDQDLVINASFILKDAEVKIYDITGRMIYSKILDQNSNTYFIEKENFKASGLYMISVSKNGQSTTQKVTVL